MKKVSHILDVMSDHAVEVLLLGSYAIIMGFLGCEMTKKDTPIIKENPFSLIWGWAPGSDHEETNRPIAVGWFHNQRLHQFPIDYSGLIDANKPVTNNVFNVSVYSEGGELGPSIVTITNIPVIVTNIDFPSIQLNFSGQKWLEISEGWKSIQVKREPIVTGPSNGWWHIEFKP